MSTSPQRRGGGLRAFRLDEVPETVRLRALERLLDATTESKDGMIVPTRRPADRVILSIIAERPSAKVHWITVEAWEKAARRWPKR